MNPKLSSIIDRKPTIGRIIFTDSASFLLTLGAIASGIFIETIPVGLGLMYFLIKRVRLIQNAFAKGVSVKALIVGKQRAYGAWKLRYRYTYQQKDYESCHQIIRFKAEVRKGETMEAFLNPEQPDTAFLSNFYLG
ncbi:hypothetical protein [Zarconia navalis]|nr:hypothetical protein [Zarconia navalis]